MNSSLKSQWAKYKLTDTDRKWFAENYPDDMEYMKQIEDVAYVMILSKETDVDRWHSTFNQITAEEAIEILGIEKFLSGLHRVAFHRSAVRYNNDESIHIHFRAFTYWDI